MNTVTENSDVTPSPDKVPAPAGAAGKKTVGRPGRKKPAADRGSRKPSDVLTLTAVIGPDPRQHQGIDAAEAVAMAASKHGFVSRVEFRPGGGGRPKGAVLLHLYAHPAAQQPLVTFTGSVPADLARLAAADDGGRHRLGAAAQSFVLHLRPGRPAPLRKRSADAVAAVGRGRPKKGAA